VNKVNNENVIIVGRVFETLP